MFKLKEYLMVFTNVTKTMTNVQFKGNIELHYTHITQTTL